MVRSDKVFKLLAIIGLVFVAFNIVCRMSTTIADFYSTEIYPVISFYLSSFSAATTLSLQDFTLGMVFLVAMVLIVYAIIGKWGWLRCVKYLSVLLLLLYAWFYTAWCNNYSRSTIYQRIGKEKTEYNQKKFKKFIRYYAKAINKEWTADTIADYGRFELEMKQFFADVPEQYGLTKPESFHHAKEMTFHNFYSSVGVRGFMAPLFAESFLNPDNEANDQPFVYAHEYSHLLSVSNEAEANWWAYHVCISSKNKAIRYSGYKGILPNVIVNARKFLTKYEYEQWFATLRPEVVDDLKKSQAHWEELRSPTMDEIQSFIYDAFLKSNNVETGMKNYSEVVQIIMSVDEEIR